MFASVRIKYIFICEIYHLLFKLQQCRIDSIYIFEIHMQGIPKPNILLCHSALPSLSSLHPQSDHLFPISTIDGVIVQKLRNDVFIFTEVKFVLYCKGGGGFWGMLEYDCCIRKIKNAFRMQPQTLWYENLENWKWNLTYSFWYIQHTYIIPNAYGYCYASAVPYSYSYCVLNIQFIHSFIHFSSICKSIMHCWSGGSMEMA